MTLICNSFDKKGNALKKHYSRSPDAPVCSVPFAGEAPALQLRDEVALWAEIVKASGAKPD